jgi:hypothetical protein
VAMKTVEVAGADIVHELSRRANDPVDLNIHLLTGIMS